VERNLYYVVPAVYEWAEERRLVSHGHDVLTEVPATYKSVDEKILEQEARVEWKKGRGLIEKVDNATGEIMCLIEVPAVYKTVTKQVLVTPAKVKTVRVDDVYKTVRYKKLVKEATTKTIVIPAEYKTLKVKKVSVPAKYETIKIPPVYNTLTKQVKVKDSHMEWRQVLCETNVSPGFITRLQRALDNKGYSPGTIDGLYGSNTKSALNSYQKAKGLAVGDITYESIKSLGITVN